jgi:very-short-patch-repair endonuclease
MKDVKRVNSPRLKNIRRLKRNHPTPWEWKLWQFLQNRQVDGHKFRRQVSIGNYVVDFCCLELRFIIEVDGSGHLRPTQRKWDAQRIKKFRAMGLHHYQIL